MFREKNVNQSRIDQRSTYKTNMLSCSVNGSSKENDNTYYHPYSTATSRSSSRGRKSTNKNVVFRMIEEETTLDQYQANNFPQFHDNNDGHHNSPFRNYTSNSYTNTNYSIGSLTTLDGSAFVDENSIIEEETKLNQHQANSFPQFHDENDLHNNSSFLNYTGNSNYSIGSLSTLDGSTFVDENGINGDEEGENESRYFTSPVTQDKLNAGGSSDVQDKGTGSHYFVNNVNNNRNISLSESPAPTITTMLPSNDKIVLTSLATMPRLVTAAESRAYIKANNQSSLLNVDLKNSLSRYGTKTSEPAVRNTAFVSSTSTNNVNRFDAGRFTPYGGNRTLTERQILNSLNNHYAESSLHNKSSKKSGRGGGRFDSVLQSPWVSRNNNNRNNSTLFSANYLNRISTSRFNGNTSLRLD